MDLHYKMTIAQVEMSLICHQQRMRQELVVSDRKLVYHD